MIESKQKVTYFIPSLFFMLLISGCLHLSQMLDFSMSPVEYQNIKKIDLRVELLFTEYLRNAKSIIDTGGLATTVNLGEAFQKNCEILVGELFSDVIVTDSASGTASRDDIDAILIPKMVSVVRDRPIFMSQTQESTIVFEWVLKDINGNIIWIDTITAEGQGPLSNSLFPSGQMGGAQIQFEDAFNKLFRLSFKKMSSSKLIKEFAASNKLKSAL